MPLIAPPADAIAVGPGILYRLPLGAALPGQIFKPTLKALTTNVATLTVAAHTFTTGDQITVALSPADPVFDGTYTVTATTATTISYAKTSANVASAAAAGTVTGPFSRAGGLVSGGVFTDAWPDAAVPFGVTKEGSQFSYQVSSDGVIVAEYIDSLSNQETERKIGMAFDLAQINVRSLTAGMNGGTVTTVSGTGPSTLTRVDPPKVGQSTRCMIGWESQDGTERLILRQCYQSAQITVARKKGTDYATIPCDFAVEQPSNGLDPFHWWFAGATRAAA